MGITYNPPGNPGAGTGGGTTSVPVEFPVEFTADGTLAAGTGTEKWPAKGALTITRVTAVVGGAPAGASIIVDVLKNGTTIFTNPAHKPTIAPAAFSSTAPAIDVPAVADGDNITVDIDQVGTAGNEGSDLVVLIWFVKLVAGTGSGSGSGVLPAGGATAQVLQKASAVDGDVIWGQIAAALMTSGVLDPARLGSGTADAFGVLFGDSSFKQTKFQDFTPTWTATTTNPTLGSDGLKVGRYFQLGKLVVYSAVFRLGTVANGANRGSGIYHFGTPVVLAQAESPATSMLYGIATLARQYGGAITDLSGHALGHLHVPSVGSGGDGTFALVVHDNVGASFESNLTRTTANVAVDQATHGSSSAWKDILTFPTLTARTPTIQVELDVDLQLRTDTATSTVVVSIREGSTELFRRVVAIKDADAFGLNDVPLRFTHVLAPVDSTAPTLGDHTYKVSAFCPGPTNATVTVSHDAAAHISGYARYTMRNAPGGSSPQYVGSDVPFLPTDEIGNSIYWILGIAEAL